MTRAALDFTQTLKAIDELYELLEDLEGAQPNLEINNKKVTSEKAEINRKLLYGAHLAEVIKIDVMSHYHLFKGANPPTMTMD